LRKLENYRSVLVAHILLQGLDASLHSSYTNFTHFYIYSYLIYRFLSYIQVIFGLTGYILTLLLKNKFFIYLHKKSWMWAFPSL